MIHNREQLISWLIRSAISDIFLQRALQNPGTRIELLGKFDPLPGSSEPGWLVRVVTVNGREDLIGIVQNYLGLPVRWFLTDYISWETWLGPNDDVLIGGDNNDLEIKTTERFDRIKKCAAVHTSQNKRGRNARRSLLVDTERSAKKNIPHSKPPRVK